MYNQTEVNIQSFTKEIETDYYKIVKVREVSNNEWSKKGDGFKIFTLYNDTTPVVASNHTFISK